MGTHPERVERVRVALSEAYRIEREIGRGGMAVVYLAEDLRHHRRVAIKILSPEVALQVGPERFLREIQTVAGLAHPHIVPLFDSGEADGLLYYVMPFIEGESLQSRIRKEGGLPVREAVRLTLEVADALGYAHGQGLVHRDVKPANIMLEEGHGVLADFGVAHAVSEASDHRLTRTGVSLGTPAYMSPEQAGGDAEIDGRSDLYSLGCVLYEMLAGTPPFGDLSLQAQYARKVTGAIPKVSEARPEVPPRVVQALETLLAPDPGDRFQDAAALTAALAPASTASARRWPRSGPLLRGLRAVAILTVALGTGVGIWNLLRSGRAFEPEWRLAVLPFEHYGQGEDAVIADGLHAQVISELQALEGLDVPHQATVARFREATVAGSLAEIAGELRAATLLTAHVIPDPDSIRVQVQLHDLTKGERLLFDERYELPRQGLRGLSRRVAADVAGHVGVALSIAESARLAKPPTNDPQAYENYLRAAQMDRERRDFDGIIRLMEDAVERDPDFAQAHALLGGAHLHKAAYYFEPSRAAFERSEVANRRALQLDSTLADAVADLAFAEAWGRFDWLEAEAGYRRALELDGSDPTINQNFGQLLVYLGRADEGIARLKRAVELDPVSPAPATFLGYGMWLSGRPGEARRQLQDMLAVFPGPATAPARTFLAGILADLGQYEEARATVDRAIELGGRQPWILGFQAMVYAQSGHPEPARSVLEELTARATAGEYVPADVMAWVLMSLGRHDEALDWLEEAYERGEQGLIYLKKGPWYEPLRGRPRFQRLLKKLRFAET